MKDRHPRLPSDLPAAMPRISISRLMIATILQLLIHTRIHSPPKLLQRHQQVQQQHPGMHRLAAVRSPRIPTHLHLVTSGYTMRLVTLDGGSQEPYVGVNDLRDCIVRLVRSGDESDLITIAEADGHPLARRRSWVLMSEEQGIEI